MKSKTLLASLIFTTLLVGCDQSTQQTTASAAEKPQTPVQRRGDIASDYRYSLQADGPDICLRRVVETLGKETKVTSVKTFFGTGKALSSSPAFVTPKGVLKTCSVEYQDPQDGKKLLSLDMDAFSGEFKAPVPVKITVTGNADSFKLDDYLIPLDKVDASTIKTFLDGKTSWLDSYFSEHALSALTLNEPGPFNDKHVLSIRMDGLLTSNGINKYVTASFSMDGKRVIKDSFKAGK